ncbi:hypothetical protein Tco_1293390 [Tanacetum coccineum]
MINQCLTGKNSGFDRPRYPVLQMLWGIITSTNVDYAELMWEEFVQAIQTFLTDKANLGSPTKKDRKDKPHVIPYCQFTKLIICHLSRKHNLHQRSESLLHLAEEDLRLGNLKFVPKGEKYEVFGMQIPNVLITDSIRNAPYYEKKSISKADPSKKSATVKQLKPKSVKEKSSKPAPAPKPKGQAHVGGVAIREPVAEATRLLPMVEGKGKAIATEEQAAQSLLALHTPKRRSTTDQFIFQRRTLATEEASTGPSAQPQDDTSANIVRDSPKQGEDVDNQVNLEEKTAELDQGHARSDPGKTPESQPPPEQVFMDEDQAGPDPRESRVALAGPNPEPMHNEFMANVYPNVHESLKFPADEHVILEDALSSFRTLSSMKNLDDAYTIRDQFLNDKSTKDEPGKLNVEAEVVSMVTVPIYQASSSVPPLSTPAIDLSPPKPITSTTQAPIFIATIVTKTTTLLPPPQQQSITDLELAARVTTLEKKLSDFEQKSNTLNNTTQNLRSRVFTLELRDLPYKINQTVNEVVKEAVHVAL